MAALDISKAFDKVNHFVLFNKQLDRAVPTCLVKVTVCWYEKCSAVIRCIGRISRVFYILADILVKEVFCLHYCRVY